MVAECLRPLERRTREQIALWPDRAKAAQALALLDRLATEGATAALRADVATFIKGT